MDRAIPKRDQLPRAPRIVLDAIVSLREPAIELVLRTRDLSSTGLFVTSTLPSALPLRVGQRVRLELLHGDEPILLTAVVARVDETGPLNGAGLRFTELDEAQRGALATLLRGA